MKKFKIIIAALAMIIAFGLTARTAKAEEINCKAAPAVAAELLKKASISPRYGTGKNGGNYISDVALFMGPKTDFKDVDKCDVDKYKTAVAQYLVKQGATNIQDLFKATLESVVYNGTCGFFGSHVDNNLVFTFSNDIYQNDVTLLEVNFGGGIQKLWQGWGKTDWNISENVLTVTATDVYSNPRDVLGKNIASINGLVDFIDNPVVPGGVSVIEGTLTYTTEWSGAFTSKRYLPGEWDYDVSITRNCGNTFESGEITLTDPDDGVIEADVAHVKDNYPYWYDMSAVSKPNLAAVGTATYGIFNGNFMFLLADSHIWMALSGEDYADEWTAETVWPSVDRDFDILSADGGFW